MVTKLRYNISQWSLIFIPIIFTLFCGMIAYSTTQMNKSLDSKASKESVEVNCKAIEKKANQETLTEIVNILSQKDDFLEKSLIEQNDRTEKIQIQQLEVLIKIERIMSKMDPGGLNDRIN